MLAFRDDPGLKDHGVLKPQWATTGIYKMLNSPLITAAGAKFTLKDFATVLDAKDYPRTVHAYLLALMERFKLCFPLNDERTRFMIPELLPADGPDLEREFPAGQSLGFAYKYTRVLPQGLLPRFIVETFRHRDPSHAWKTGVVLEQDNCRAWIRGDVEAGLITVRMSGPPTGYARRALLGLVRDHFRRIHRSYQDLPVVEQVPVPGHPTVMVPYETLLLAENGDPPVEKIQLVIEKKFVNWSVRELLDGVGRMPEEAGRLGLGSLPRLATGTCALA
jgi:internalin A